MRAAALVVLLAAGTAHADAYDVRIPDKLELTAGTPGTLGITITLDRGLTISRDAALQIDLAPDAGVSIKRLRLSRTDAVDPEADAPRFAIAVKSDAAGAYNIKVHAKFWLCATHTCRPIDVRRTVSVTVSP